MADFAPIASYLRKNLGITLEPGLTGLVTARLCSNVQRTGWPSFTMFYRRVILLGTTAGLRQTLRELCNVDGLAGEGV
jgi:hypothetical protein